MNLEWIADRPPALSISTCIYVYIYMYCLGSLAGIIVILEEFYVHTFQSTFTITWGDNRHVISRLQRFALLLFSAAVGSTVFVALFTALAGSGCRTPKSHRLWKWLTPAQCMAKKLKINVANLKNVVTCAWV